MDDNGFGVNRPGMNKKIPICFTPPEKWIFGDITFWRDTSVDMVSPVARVDFETSGSARGLLMWDKNWVNFEVLWCKLGIFTLQLRYFRLVKGESIDCPNRILYIQILFINEWNIKKLIVILQTEIRDNVSWRTKFSSVCAYTEAMPNTNKLRARNARIEEVCITVSQNASYVWEKFFYSR